MNRDPIVVARELRDVYSDFERLYKEAQSVGLYVVLEPKRQPSSHYMYIGCSPDECTIHISQTIKY